MPTQSNPSVVSQSPSEVDEVSIVGPKGRFSTAPTMEMSQRSAPPDDAAPLSHTDALLPSFDHRLVDLGVIASGGMGVIHRVRDRLLRRELALKVLHSSDGEGDATARFALEARVTAWLDHPSIVPIYDLGTFHGEPCFLMKLVEGITLHSELVGGPAWGASRLRDEWLLEALMKVCDALSLAHRRGVIHRDIKPDNIMLGSFSQVYLMDWGVALLRGDAAEGISGGGEALDQPAFAGTLQYMSPEQAVGDVERIDQRSDVYLLGGVLYEMITGCAPRPHTDNLYASVYAATSTPVRPCWEVSASVPDDLAHTAMRALERDPDARFASALDFKAALRAALQSS